MLGSRLTAITLLLVLYLSGLSPAAGSSPEMSEQSVPITIVLDCSASMSAAMDGETETRIEMAWQAVQQIYDLQDGQTVQPDEKIIPGSTANAGDPYPGLYLAGGDTETDPCRSCRLLTTRQNGDPAPPSPANFILETPPPTAAGILPLVYTLSQVTRPLPVSYDRLQGVVILLAAGWEGCVDNPTVEFGGFHRRFPGLLLHVIGLSPGKTNEGQLTNLAAVFNGAYVSATNRADLDRTLSRLTRNGTLRFTARSPAGAPPLPGSRILVNDRNGYIEWDMAYDDWLAGGGERHLPAGTYQICLRPPRMAEPLCTPDFTISAGRISSEEMTLPPTGELNIQLETRDGSSRLERPIIDIFDDQEHAVARVINRDSVTLPLYPGTYRICTRPYRNLGRFDERSESITIRGGDQVNLVSTLPPEGTLSLLPDPSLDENQIRRVRITVSDRSKTEIWSGKIPKTLILPAGRYRVAYRIAGTTETRRKKVRIRSQSRKELVLLPPFPE